MMVGLGKATDNIKTDIIVGKATDNIKTDIIVGKAYKISLPLLNN
jgi:ribonucleotide monophosphatase NagD (HAD superfamily)